MPGAILPVKRPETDPGLIPRRQRDLVACAYTRINAKSLPPDLNGNKKMPIMISMPKENFLQSANPKSDR
jgi:hypothetical protein